MNIVNVNKLNHAELMPQLIDLLVDAVTDGASIGFMPPLARDEAQAYWESTFAAVAASDKVMLLAMKDDRVVGSVQLGLEHRPNGNHRGEVQKLMVHTAYRRRGIARQLMTTIEQYARDQQRTLIVLDTREGDPSELLYQSLGYVQAGKIPQFARSANGQLDATIFYYKRMLRRTDKTN